MDSATKKVFAGWQSSPEEAVQALHEQAHEFAVKTRDNWGCEVDNIRVGGIFRSRQTLKAMMICHLGSRTYWVGSDGYVYLRNVGMYPLTTYMGRLTSAQIHMTDAPHVADKLHKMMTAG